MKHKKISAFSLLFTILLLMIGCNFPGFVTSKPYTPTPTSTSTKIPTSSPTVSPSPTFTATTTSTPTQTTIPTPVFYALENTPLPENLSVISETNAQFTSCLAEIREDPIVSMKWIPDGKSLALGTQKGVILYDRTTHSKTKAIDTGDGLVSFDISPDGKWLATGHQFDVDIQGYASKLKVWYAPDYPLMAVFGDIRSLTSIAYMPNGKTLAVAYTNNSNQESWVEFRNTYTWEITRTIQTGIILDLSFSPSGDLLASIPDKYAIRVWDMNKGVSLYNLYTSFTGAVNSLAFSPDGKLLASGHYDGSIQLWDTSTGNPLNHFSSEGVIESLAFSPDGSILAVGLSYQSNEIQLWSISKNEMLSQLLGHNHAVDNLEFSSDGRLLASASYDGIIRLWGLRP